MFYSLYILKCVKSLHGHAGHFVVLSCEYIHHFLLLLSDTNSPEKVSRPGERADHLCLPQLFITTDTTRKLACVHSNHMETLVFTDVHRQNKFNDALMCL